MKHILLGVTASVAAVKTVSLVEGLSQFAKVSLVITQQADYFLQSQLDALTQLGVTIYRDSDEWPALNGPYQVGSPILHIELRRTADCFLLAPMDANTLAKIANGFCDNLLTSVIRAWDWTKPMLLCPAMNTLMWGNPPTLDQIKKLKEWGAIIIEPVEKKLACQDVGMGGMAEVADIIEIVKKIL